MPKPQDDTAGVHLKYASCVEQGLEVVGESMVVIEFRLISLRW